MRIEALKSERGGTRCRVAATVVWEDCDRPSREIYFETDQAFGGDLACNPNAFLLGSYQPAMRHGERRIRVEGEICPELHEGLRTAMAWNRLWHYRADTPLPVIEAKMAGRGPEGPRRTGAFLSGGIDSLSMLRRNQLRCPAEHPARIRDCLLIYGTDIGGVLAAGDERRTYELLVAALQNVARDAGVTLIPVATNVRYLDDNLHFWVQEYYGAVLMAVAHAFAPRLASITMASDKDLATLDQFGSHPLVTMNYGGWDLKFFYDGLRLPRQERVQLVADWDAGLNNLRVCTRNVTDRLNCGHCEKCLRTMLGLLALGALGRCRAFAADDLTPAMLRELDLSNMDQITYYQDLMGPLRAIGREDLVRILAHKIAKLEHGPTLLDRLKEDIYPLDQKYLFGMLTRLNRRLRD